MYASHVNKNLSIYLYGHGVNGNNVELAVAEALGPNKMKRNERICIRSDFAKLCENELSYSAFYL